ncbi:4Fe-4S cluster-binding domain-containing protein [Paraliobacillus ryukyuensis]|uniref:4Fe-4S cluster-binding domain-containing protein n=1 Tax=Paraliobacillus ryukyuensis TaxID=200904 RepID=UPI0009A913AA|nr:4Fe-4S cluster-binding domain-containing protein [Paraliobacillus ryukyuensis]
MARLHQIKHIDIENTYWGYATSLWFNGCSHRCDGCWNSETWERDYSLEIDNQSVINETLVALDEYFPKDLSLLGGDPLAPYNVNDTKEILESILKKRPSTKVLCWTGYTWEQITNSKILNRALPYIDILIDGKYIKELHVDGHKYGSTNQRIIDVKASLRDNVVVKAPETHK